MQLSAITGVLLCLAVTVANSRLCPNLGTAANFAVVAGSGATNTGSTVINGNLGVSPITALTGFPPGIITGVKQLGNAISAKAQADATAAYTYCKNAKSTKDLTGINLAGLTLTPGVYTFSSTAEISVGGILTLNGAGVYIFQVGSALITGAGIQIKLEGGAKAGCVFWAVVSSATHGASSQFTGNILAYASSTFGNGVTYDGSIYTQTGDVTFITANVTPQAKCVC